jgi:heat shock protein HslJ
MKACADEKLSTEEQHYLAALQLAKSYRIRGDQLELQRPGGTIAATFEPTPAR